MDQHEFKKISTELRREIFKTTQSQQRLYLFKSVDDSADVILNNAKILLKLYISQLKRLSHIIKEKE